MELYYIVDVVLICVALGIVMRSYRKGLVASVIRLVGTLAAYAGAWIVSGPISKGLYTNFARGWVEQFAADLVPADLQTTIESIRSIGGLESMGITIGEAGKEVSQRLAEMLGEYGLNNLPFGLSVDSESLGSELTALVMEKGLSAAQALTQALLEPLATAVLRVAAFVVVFSILSILVSILYRIGVGFNHLPLIGGVNRLLGACVGLLEAAIVLYLLCAALAIVSALLGGQNELLSWSNLQNAKLFSYIVGFNPPAGLGIL